MLVCVLLQVYEEEKRIRKWWKAMKLIKYASKKYDGGRYMFGHPVDKVLSEQLPYWYGGPE